MTKKILYWLDRNFIIFAAANKLQNKLNSDNYAIFDDVENQKNFFSNQSLINFKKIWHFTDYVQMNNTQPDYDLLSKFEKKYSLSFWHIAYTERLFYSKINLYNKFNESQILSLFQQECQFFEKVLDDIKPDYLIINAITQHHMLLLYHICKAKGIKVLTMEPTHLGGKWIITSNIDKHIDPEKYKQFTTTANESFLELQNYLQNHKVIGESKDVTRHKTSKIVKIKSASKFLFKSNTKEKHFAVYGKTKSSVLKKGTAKSYQYRKKKRKIFIDKNLINKIDSKDKIIYFPLTYEPEKTILVGSPFFTNQIALVSYIAKSIPVGYTLYVKEHPMMEDQGWRDKFYYEQIMDLPNIKLIHPDVSHDELIKNCHLAMTIRGTIGLEATCQGKPVINFNHTSGYSELSSVRTVTDLEKLPEAISSSFDKKVELSDVNKYFDYMKKISFYYDQTDFSSEFSKKFNYQAGYLYKVKININEMSSFLEEFDSMFEIVSDAFTKHLND